MESVLSLRDVRKSFGSLVVLDGVNLDLYPAENVVVLGRSGSGKSVLIKIVVGLLEADSGSVQVLGQSVPELSYKALSALRLRVGFSFQGGALYDGMNVRENLAFPLQMSGRRASDAEIDKKVKAALESVGLPQTIGQMPSELSGGQRKRVSIARTLMLEPEIMLYDEPTAGLDPVTSAEINDLILSVRKERKTSAIVITHDLTCAKATGDRIAMLLDGRIARTGSFEEVFATQDRRVRDFYDYNFIGPSGSRSAT